MFFPDWEFNVKFKVLGKSKFEFKVVCLIFSSLATMIIKRNLKSQMPGLKRSRLGDSAGEDEENSAVTRKKRKTNGNNNNSKNGYYPLNLLGEVAAGIIPVSFKGIISSEKGFAASWCTELSCFPGEVESEKKVQDLSRAKVKSTRVVAAEVPRPPLVKTSRGRVQVLPSRFNDSVIENWRKDSKTSLRDYGLHEDTECKRDKFSIRRPKINSRDVKRAQYDGKTEFKSGKNATLCEEEEERKDEGYVAFKNYRDIRKYSSSRSTLTSANEQLGEDEKCQVAEVEERVELFENGERKDGLFGPEDFYSGDIVWAKPGKKEPYWPAIVIDPMTQAPELVLRSCIADAACVMFFGYSGNENQRVWISFYM